MKRLKFKNSILSYFLGGITIGLLILVFLVKPEPEKEDEVFEAEEKEYKVEKVIDGDTIRLSDGRNVRLIGVDTPETHHPEIPVQVFAEEASEFTKQLCEGFFVKLEYDIEREDKYNRTLAYVYLDDGRMVNEELIKRGYAYVLRRFPFKRKEEFLILQDKARSEGRGLWSYNLSNARLANITERFDGLSEEGKERFDKELDKLLDKYPKENGD